MHFEVIIIVYYNIKLLFLFNSAARRDLRARHAPSPLAGEGPERSEGDEGSLRRRERSSLAALYPAPTPHSAFGHLLPQGEKGRTGPTAPSLSSGFAAPPLRSGPSGDRAVAAGQGLAMSSC